MYILSSPTPFGPLLLPDHNCPVRSDSGIPTRFGPKQQADADTLGSSGQVTPPPKPPRPELGYASPRDPNKYRHLNVHEPCLLPLSHQRRRHSHLPRPPRSVSGSVVERMRRLRDECNQTPSPLRPKPRPVQLAAGVVERSPTMMRRIEVKQQQRTPNKTTLKKAGTRSAAARQQTIKLAEISQEQDGSAVATHTPRMSKFDLKAYPPRNFHIPVAAMSQPHLPILYDAVPMTVAPAPLYSVAERASKVPHATKEVTHEEGLPPMYFTMKYKNSRDSGATAQATKNGNPPVSPSEDDDFKPHHSRSPWQPKDSYNNVDQLTTTNLNPTEEEYKLEKTGQRSVANRNNSPKHKPLMHGTDDKRSQADPRSNISPSPQPYHYLPQVQKKYSSSPPYARHSQACRSPANTSPITFQMKQKAKTYSHLRTPLYEDTSTTGKGTTTAKVLGKLENKPRALVGLSLRSFSWGNGLLGTNRKENSPKSNLVRPQTNRQNPAKTVGAVYEKVRNFEALTSGVTQQENNATRQESISRSRLQDLNVRPEEGSRRKNWYHSQASSMRQYLGVRSKGEPLDVKKNLPPPHLRCEDKRLTKKERLGTNCTSKPSKHRSSLDKVRQRVSGTTQPVKPYSEIPNPIEQNLKQRNPEDGRFPPWPGSVRRNIISTGIHGYGGPQSRGAFAPAPQTHCKQPTGHLEQPKREVGLSMLAFYQPPFLNQFG